VTRISLIGANFLISQPDRVAIGQVITREPDLVNSYENFAA
jgi:hypothetical protein